MTANMPLNPAGEEILEAFNRCSEFNRFSKKEQSELLRFIETEEFSENDQVFGMDQTGQKFYLVIYGKFSVRLKSNDYRECKAGDIFGEIAVFSKKHRLGTVMALEPSKVAVFNSDHFLNAEILSPDLILKLVKALTRKMISYFYHEELLSNAEMIRRGENKGVEFKASMHKNVVAPVVRTLSAFMNSNGGTLFIGVENNGNLKGIKAGNTEFDDFEKSTRGLIRRSLGAFHNSIVYFSVENLEQKQILRIDCDASKDPVFYRHYDQNGKETEEFVIRTGSVNTQLKKAREIIRYWKKRFGRPGNDEPQQ